MKLKHIPVKESSVQLSLSMRGGLVEDLDRYARYVAKQSGTRLSRREIVALIVEQFLAEDRGFREFSNQSSRQNPDPPKTDFPP